MMARVDEIVGDVGHRHIDGVVVIKAAHAGVDRGVEEVDEERVGVGVPVADVLDAQRGAGDFLAAQVDAAETHRVELVVIEVVEIGGARRIHQGVRFGRGGQAEQGQETDDDSNRHLLHGGPLHGEGMPFREGARGAGGSGPCRAA